MIEKKDFRNRFKKFGGEFIPDIIEYLREYVEQKPTVTISVGCDSIQKRRKTIYACTIMMHDKDIRNGAHVVFFREYVNKIRDNNDRLYKEALYVYEIAEFLNDELNNVYIRKDITDFERKAYKFHILRCNGEYDYVPLHNQESFISNLALTDYEKSVEYKLVDIHVDFNPVEGNLNEKGVRKNKSNAAYHAYVPWLKGLGYRVYSKNIAHASTSAADLLLKD